ncbi:MAG: NAD(P)-dependent oxidoreductase [Patescibacteria group bacterium]
MKQKIFVTGAAGFVGSHLVPVLQSSGYEVTGLVRKTSEEKNLPKTAHVVVGDLAKKGSWKKEVKNHQILIHLAAEISSKDEKTFVRNNVIATQNLVKAAKAAGIKKIILFSSAAVTSIRRDPYAETKQEQENIIRKSKIPHYIIRPSMIYGSGDTKNIGWLIKIISRLPIVPLPGGGNFGRQPIYVDDIAKIVLKLTRDRYKKEIFEIHGKEYVTMAKMVEVILAKKKIKRIIIPVPLALLIIFFWVLGRIAKNPKFTVDQIKSLISGERFKGEKWWQTFAIIPTTFEAGVSEMVKGQK